VRHLDIEKTALHDIEAAWKNDDVLGRSAVIDISKELISKRRRGNMLKHIYLWHREIENKISAKFGLSDDMSHHHRLNHQRHNVKRRATKHGVESRHKNFHSWQEEHNKHIAEFHKKHAAEIEAAENGIGLFERWERWIYNKGKALFKAAK